MIVNNPAPKLIAGGLARFDSDTGEPKFCNIVAHPVRPDRFLAVLPAPSQAEEGVWIVNADGRDTWGTRICFPLDPVREAWDALPSAQRGAITMLARNCGRKITAVKLLRSLTDLGLAEAKRAVEDFNV